MLQAPCFDCLPFDPFSLFQNGLGASEVDVGRGNVAQASPVFGDVFKRFAGWGFGRDLHAAYQHRTHHYYIGPNFSNLIY